MVNSLVDCPHREKCLWGGDLHASWAFGFYAIDSANFYRHQVRLSYTGQKAPGDVPGNIMVGKRISGNTSSFNWSVSPLFIAWWLYQHWGDTETFRTYYNSIRHFLDYFNEHAIGGIPHLTKLADHAPPVGIEREAPNNELISALNFFAAASRFELMAKALEKNEDVEWARGIAQKSLRAVLQFYQADLHSFGNGTHDSLALAFRVLTDPDEERLLAASLVNHYRQNGHKFDGGFLSYWIYPMLSRFGYADDALKMMRNPDYPGPAWSIVHYDATTFWESFMPDESMQFNRSLNHHAIDHPAAWLLTDLAGIRLDDSTPGDRKLILSPAVPVNEKLDWVEASLHTQQGMVKSSWTKNGNKVSWEFSIPPNSEASLFSPAGASIKFPHHDVKQRRENGRLILGPGTYRMNWHT